MPPSHLQGSNVDIQVWAPIHEVESQALDQLKNCTRLPWVFHHVAAMPDVHLGHGATVGSVVAMKGALSPSMVGVDIGCGMGAIKTNLTAKDLPESLKSLRKDIESSIPVGFNDHRDPVKGVQTLSLWRDFKNLNPKVQKDQQKAMKQCGSLGGGNHFISVDLDTEQNVWLMLHSGSRNIGKTLAETHISIAKKLIHNADLPDPDLAAFLAGTSEMENYRHDLLWCQDYAMENRRTMLSLLKIVMKKHFPQITYGDSVFCHHNYVAEECHFGENVFVTRKGAIRAGKGEMGIIPGSMGTNSYIVRGLGNPDSFESASHGAGRAMSRGKAKKLFTMDDLAEQTKGIECRKDQGVIDEAPLAYKNIEQVMANQTDLVEVVAQLKSVLVVKG